MVCEKNPHSFISEFSQIETENHDFQTVLGGVSDAKLQLIKRVLKCVFNQEEILSKQNSSQHVS